MKTPQFHAKIIEQYLDEKKYATLDDLKGVIGTSVSMTVFRKLKELDYLSSCSHRGKYYSLERIATFDEFGLWRPDGILFSRFGTLLDTVEYFVHQSQAGYTAIELRKWLSIEVKEQLMQLWVETRLSREIVDGLYVYTSAEAARKQRQLVLRRNHASRDVSSPSIQHEIKASILLFYSMLDEKQRRIYAGLESMKHGRGGDAIIGRLLDIDVHTVAKGRKQLLESDIEIERVRRMGAGRIAIKKKALK